MKIESVAVACLALTCVLSFAAPGVAAAQDPAPPQPAAPEQQPAPATPAPADSPQTPAPPAGVPSTPPGDPFTFPGGAGMIFWQVKADQVEGFELVWSVIRGRLAASDKANLRAMDAGLTIFKEETLPDQDASYIFFINPAVPALSYSVSPFLLYDSGLFERPEADELFGVLQKATVRLNAIPMVRVGQ